MPKVLQIEYVGWDGLISRWRWDHNRSFLHNLALISGPVVRGLISDDSLFSIRNARWKRITNNSRPYGRPKQAFKRDNITFGSLLILTIRILMPKIHGFGTSRLRPAVGRISPHSKSEFLASGCCLYIPIREFLHPGWVLTASGAWTRTTQPEEWQKYWWNTPLGRFCSATRTEPAWPRLSNRTDDLKWQPVWSRGPDLSSDRPEVSRYRGEDAASSTGNLTRPHRASDSEYGTQKIPSHANGLPWTINSPLLVWVAWSLNCPVT